MELQQKTHELIGTSTIIDTNNVCGEVQLVKLTIVVANKIDKVRVRSTNIYGCNNDFALFMVDEVWYKCL